MTIKIVGCWDIWEESRREHEVHWRFMLKHFGVETLYMTPDSGIAESISAGLDSTEVEVVGVASLQAAIDANPGLTPVLIDENGTTAVNDFVHPANVLYIFGRVGCSPLDMFGNQYASVRVPSWATDPNASLSLLHPHQAAAIVLYDHRMKQ